MSTSDLPDPSLPRGSEAGGSELSDEEFLRHLREAAGLFDPVPAAVDQLARDALSWRDIDGELAELVADSRAMADSVRGTSGTVVLRFEAGELSLTIEAAVRADGAFDLLGQVEPAQPGEVELRQDSPRRVACDNWGRFELRQVPAATVSLRWQPAGPSKGAVNTAWFQL